MILDFIAAVVSILEEKKICISLLVYELPHDNEYNPNLSCICSWKRMKHHVNMFNYKDEPLLLIPNL